MYEQTNITANINAYYSIDSIAVDFMVRCLC